MATATPNVHVEWLAYPYREDAPALERGVYVRPGYDCREGCVHDPPVAGHGCHGDEWVLAMRAEDFAVEATYFTRSIDRQLLSGFDTPVVTPAWCHIHCGFVLLENDVRDGDPGAECHLLRSGRCWSEEGPRLADAFLSKRDIADLEEVLRDAAPTRAFVVRMLGWPEAPWWKKMARFLDERRRAALDEHASLPEQCPTCKGAGVVSK